jgi:tyrosyl-tRNA synthetase
MAREVVGLYHGREAAQAAEERFDLVHREHAVPDDVPAAEVLDGLAKDGRVWLPKLLVAVGFAKSNAEARRLVEQGGARLDGEQLGDPGAELPVEDLRGHTLQAGSHRFVRLS